MNIVLGLNRWGQEANLQNIQVDNAATTKMDRIVFKAMLPYIDEDYVNSSSVYSLAKKSKEAIKNAKISIASCIGT